MRHIRNCVPIITSRIWSRRHLGSKLPMPKAIHWGWNMPNLWVMCIMKQGTEVPFITLRCAGSFDDKQMTVREDVIIPRTPLYENQVGRIQAHCPTWHSVL